MSAKATPAQLKTKAPASDIAFDAQLDALGLLARNLNRKPQTTTPIFESDALARSGRAILHMDILALVTAFLLGGLGALLFNKMIGESFQPIFSKDTLYEFIIFMAIGGMALFWLDGKNHCRQRLPFWESLEHIARVAIIGLVAGGFIQFALKSSYSRLWLGLSWGLFATFLCFGRVWVRMHFTKLGRWQIPALMIGNHRTALAAYEALQGDKQMGYSFVGCMAAQDVPTIGGYASWRAYMLANHAQHLFIALEGSELERFEPMIQRMVRERVPYSLVPPFIALPSSTMSAHHFMMRDVMLMHNTNRLSLPLPRLLKRSFDLVAASLALAVLGLPMLIVAMLVRRDGGPALFAQPRVGRDGKLFSCYKFRSMRVDAPAALQAHLERDPEAAKEWSAFQKLKNDPRITAFGRFIRKYSIDELPQLLNVLKGEMSLVGPRPIMEGQEHFYGDDFSYYEAVCPGITGPWQVSGRNRLTFSERVRLEVWYARNWTLWLDIVIILKTIPALLQKDEAF